MRFALAALRTTAERLVRDPGVPPRFPMGQPRWGPRTREIFTGTQAFSENWGKKESPTGPNKWRSRGWLAFPELEPITRCAG